MYAIPIVNAVIYGLAAALAGYAYGNYSGYNEGQAAADGKECFECKHASVAHRGACTAEGCDCEDSDEWP